MENNLPENKPGGQNVEDFGTGSVEPSDVQTPKPEQPSKPQPEVQQPQAAPQTQPAQAPAPKEQPQAAKPAPRPPVKAVPPGKRVLSKDEIIQREAKRNKRILIGCGGTFGCGTILLIVLIFVFVGTAGTGSSALAQALGINQGDLVNTLILIVNFFFGLGAFIAFILSIAGIFRAVMARKDDKITKRKGYILSGGAFGALILIIILWIGSWYYLSSQQIPTEPTSAGIVTVPPETLNLTAPVEITFDASKLAYDTRNYDVISYFWDFGDGSAGAGSNLETHRYERKGTGRYDAKLTLTFKNKTTDEESTESLTHIITIADEKVVAVMSADTVVGKAPLTVNFDGSESTDPDGSIATYAWEIDGAGFSEGEPEFEYTFEQVGSYTVKLRVANAKGDFDIAEEEITVTAGDKPIPVIDVLNSNGDLYYVGQTYTFDASETVSPAGAVTKYEWDFGDGTTTAKTRSAQHSFSTEGTYKVILSVTDEDNNTADATLEIEVKTAASVPTAVMTTDPAKASADDNFIEGIVPLEVNFDGLKSTDPDDDIIDYKWDFDNDGTYDASGETTAYVFDEVATHTVTLVVIDSSGLEAKDVILVKAMSRGLEPLVSAEPVSGVVPLTVDFDATGSVYSDGEIVSYEWDFGDGSLPRSDVGQVTYKYTKIGNFTIKVKVRTNDGKEDTAEVLVSVRQVPLKSCYEMTNETGDAPLTTTFNPQCSTGTIAKYRWDFGDGQTSAERKPVHIFENPGSFEVELEVSDAQNVVDTSSQFVTVTGELT